MIDTVSNVCRKDSWGTFWPEKNKQKNPPIKVILQYACCTRITVGTRGVPKG